MSWLKREDIIKNIDGEPQLYLRRWHLLRTPWFKLYLHKFYAPDLDRDPHDHPWDSWILMLWGKYRERLFDIDQERGLSDQGYELVRRGPSLRKMTAETIHKITELLTPHVWTLFLCKGKKRDWGFHTPNGWVCWRDYLNDYEVKEVV